MGKFRIAILIAALAAAAQAQTARIMTQNMDDGTNNSYLLAFANTNPKVGVDLTLAEIVASNIPERAWRLAGSIAAERPDIVGLQEVSLWRFGLTPATADFVLYDQLKLLLAALAARGVPYRAVAVNNLTDIALPATVGAVRLTDRDALLVRSDLPASFQVRNPQAHVFAAGLPILGFQIQAGWISADVQVESKVFHLVSTHLTSAIPGVPATTAVQVAQAQELVNALQSDTDPVILSGDFNSDANHGNGPDATPTFALIESAGYADDWASVHPSDPGPTWPVFLQDQTPPKFFAPSTPFERIDLFFSKGLQVMDETRIITPAPETPPGFASDHAGVITTLRP